MAKLPSPSNPRPEHLVVLENVQIHELLTGPRGDRYFEVEHEGKTLHVRVSSHPDTIKAIEDHVSVPLDVTIFPYKWEIPSSGKFGVINFYYNAKLHKGES